jgi:dTDP-4-amino-4,6-dideoxygalactose transaminase
VWHLYVIRSERRDDLKAFLGEHDIPTIMHYPTPIHMQPAYAELGYKKGDFPVTELASEQILSLPMYAELTDAQIEYVASAVSAFSATK